MSTDERQAGAEIEVTPEMISAGVAALANHDMRDGEWNVIVEDVFTEMIRLWIKKGASSDASLQSM